MDLKQVFKLPILHVFNFVNYFLQLLHVAVPFHVFFVQNRNQDIRNTPNRQVPHYGIYRGSLLGTSLFLIKSNMNYKITSVSFKSRNLKIASSNFCLKPYPLSLLERYREVPLGLSEYFQLKGILIDLEGNFHWHFAFREFISSTREFAKNEIARLKPVMIRCLIIIVRQL